MIGRQSHELQSERSFPADAASAAAARDFVRATLADWRCEHLIDEAVLVVSELVTNAALHTGTGATVILAASGRRLHLEVHDLDPTRLPVQQSPQTTEPHGRGLLIVDRVAVHWSTEVQQGRKIVRCVLDGKSTER